MQTRSFFSEFDQQDNLAIIYKLPLAVSWQVLLIPALSVLLTFGKVTPRRAFRRAWRFLEKRFLRISKLKPTFGQMLQTII